MEEIFQHILRTIFLGFLMIVIWPPDKDSHVFMDILNSIHPSICYTMEVNENSLPFLDVLVKLENDIISTDLYSKPTDSHNYLNFHSNHTKHIKVNIPFNLASRYVTIIRDKDILNTRLEELAQFLKAQGYPYELVKNGIHSAVSKGPFTSRGLKENEPSKIIPFVSTFNPHNDNIFPVVKNKCEELKQRSCRMKEILDKHTLINSKRQPKNLKRLLTFSKFDSICSIPKVSKCNTPRCGTCNMIIECSTFTFRNGFVFTVRANMNCKSRNVIYAIICDNCNDFYIGQTGNELRQRMTVHRQQTRNNDLRFLHVNKHIHRCSNNVFKVIPLYQMYSNDTIQRETKETELIRLLKPSLNSAF